MFGGLGSAIMQGMAFGGGSAIAHRAVDAVAGPREMRVTHEGGEAPHGAASAPAPAAAAEAVSGAPAPDCSSYMADMNKCLGEHSADIALCQPQVDIFKSCTSGELMR